MITLINYRAAPSLARLIARVGGAGGCRVRRSGAWDGEVAVLGPAHRCSQMLLMFGRLQ